VGAVHASRTLIAIGWGTHHGKIFCGGRNPTALRALAALGSL
jgi:hypothetical protein